MQMPDRERLFAALFDESEFASALDDIAATIGARSYLGGFTFSDGSRMASVSSGYFSHEQEACYYEQFFDQDPWSGYLLEHWEPARLADPGAFLTIEQIERSGLYQDFFRPMGDDTFYALCIPTETAQGIGAIAFQRGRGKSGFSERAKEELASIAPDLARILALRCRLQGLERDILARSSALQALGEGLIMLDAQGRIVMANAAAETELRTGRLLRVEKGRLSCRAARQRNQLAAKLESVGELGQTALRVEDGEGALLDLTFLALPKDSGRARTLVAFPAAPQPSRADVLRQLYGLSAGEAEIAVMLTDGLDPANIAEARGTSLNTVRAQLRTVGEKMGCSRLIDIVRRVAALPRIGEAPHA